MGKATWECEAWGSREPDDLGWDQAIIYYLCGLSVGNAGQCVYEGRLYGVGYA